MKLNFIVLSFVCLFLAACAAQVKPQISANPDYGAPAPANYQQIIKASFGKNFVSPRFSVYQFSPPAKGYVVNNPFGSRNPVYGWVACGYVNSKPANGGYSGFRGPAQFFVLFRDGVIVDKLVGQPTSEENGAPDRTNDIVSEVCFRTATGADAPK